MGSDNRWTIAGFDGAPVRNRFQSKSVSNRALAVLFPGYAYPIDAPLLHYSSRLLLEAGFDVLAVDYRYNEETRYQQAADRERREWFRADIDAVYRAMIARPDYERVLLLGKSIGTLAMLQLLQGGLPWKELGFVWLTPAAGKGELARTLQGSGEPSIVVIGTHDQFYAQTEVERLAGLANVEVKIIEGVDHGLDYANDVVRSAKLLAEVLEWIKSFVESRLG